MQIPPIPKRLIESTQGYFRTKGEAWLDRLPGLVAEAADRWHLRLSETSPAVGTGYVCFAHDDTTCPVVLKIAFPHGEHFTGVEAMRVWGGRGCVRLLDTAEVDGKAAIYQPLPILPAPAGGLPPIWMTSSIAWIRK